jgi:hypothetical protein
VEVTPVKTEKKGVNCFTPSLSIPLRKSYFFLEVFFAAFFFFAMLSPPLGSNGCHQLFRETGALDTERAPSIGGSETRCGPQDVS